MRNPVLKTCKTFLSLFLVAAMLLSMTVCTFAAETDTESSTSEAYAAEYAEAEVSDSAPASIRVSADCGYAETSVVVKEGTKLTPEVNGPLPEGAYFTTSSSSVIAINKETGKISGKKPGHAKLSICVMDEQENVTVLSTTEAYCYRPTQFSIKKNGTPKTSPEPYRILSLWNDTNEYTNKVYPLYRQQFDKDNGYQNYAWIGAHGCAAVAVADIAQAFGAKYMTPVWLYEEGIRMIGKQSGLSESTLESKMPSDPADDGGSPLGWTGMQDVLAYAGISSKIGTWKADNVVPAATSITKALSEGRPVVLVVYNNKWENPRTGETIALGSTYHFILLTGIDEDGYVLNSCGSSANVQTNNALSGYEVKITVSELLEHFIRTEKYADRTKSSDFFFSVKGGSGSLVYLEVTTDHIENVTPPTMEVPAPVEPEPVVPEEPIVPEELVAPEEPVKPEEPVVPEEPVKPEEPVVPEEPAKPEEPVIPEEPVKPEEPVVPEEPADPAEKISIEGMDAVLSKTSYTYTGKECCPTVTLDGLTEGKDKDFTCAYTNHVNAGTATVTIIGRNNYTGTIKKTYTIKKAKPTITVSSKKLTTSSKKQSIKLEAKCSPGLKLTYQSDNSKVKVSSKGTVTVAANYIGKAAITVLTPGNSNYKAASKEITVTVRPKKPTLSSVASPKKKNLVVKWKKASVSGYQIQYSYSSDFKTNRIVGVSKKSASKKMDWLTSGHKCYVRMRCYKTVNGEKVYSAWTKAKTVKIK